MTKAAVSEAPGDRPRVAIIIPCFNGELYLAEALSSAVSQTYDNIEVVFVDDGSTDHSVEIARGFPQVRIVSQANAGVSAARNAGLDASRSEFALFLDADDRLAPDAVQSHLDAFSDQPDAPMVYGAMRIIDVVGNVIEQNPREDGRVGWRRLLLMIPPMPSQSMFRRDQVDAAGRFDTSASLVEDFELMLALSRVSDLYGHGRMVVDYRRHPQQVTMRMAESLVHMLRAVDKFLLTVEDRADAARLRKEARAWWITFHGTYIPYEVLRGLRSRKWGRAAAATGVFVRYLPRTAVASLKEIGSRVGQLVS